MYPSKSILDKEMRFLDIKRNTKGITLLQNMWGVQNKPIDSNRDLDEEVYMKQTEGFSSRDAKHLACKLKKSTYMDWNKLAVSGTWNSVMSSLYLGL